MKPNEQAELARLVCVYRVASGITNKQVAMDQVFAHVQLMERRAFERGLLAKERRPDMRR